MSLPLSLSSIPRCELEDIARKVFPLVGNLPDFWAVFWDEAESVYEKEGVVLGVDDDFGDLMSRLYEWARADAEAARLSKRAGVSPRRSSSGL